MASSKVAFVHVEQYMESVFEAVSRAMNLVEWDSDLIPNSIFLKVNLLSREVMPGQCTSPWVFEGVLREIRAKFPNAKISYGDCEVATSRQVDDAVESWGFTEIGDRFDAKFINLSMAPAQTINVGPIFGALAMPKVLLDVEALITMPVIKTHCITPFTGALKNQWGLLPRGRFKFHPVVHEAIAEVNSFFAQQLKLGVADATVAMEGPGPRVGIPKVCDRIIASRDLVALDSLVGDYMGLNVSEIRFIQEAEKNGLGHSNFIAVGDSYAPNPFEKGRGQEYVIYRWRDRISNTPVLREFLQQEWFFKPLGWIAAFHARHNWYRKVGRKRALNICKKTGYGEQFAQLLERC